MYGLRTRHLIIKVQRHFICLRGDPLYPYTTSRVPSVPTYFTPFKTPLCLCFPKQCF